MLYDRWRAIAHAHRSETALRDFASGHSWTFAELASEAELRDNPSGPVAYPSGIDAEFVLTVLRAWRRSQLVCPVEGGHLPPDLPGLPGAGVVHLKTTSGTTGEPRFIAFTGEQLAADAANIVSTMGLHPDSPNIGVISLAHSYGFSNLITPLLLHGIPLFLQPAPLPEAVRRAASAHPAVTLPAVPALWRAWHAANAIPASIRLAISAGAPLPLALEQEFFDQRGLKLHNFYGASECGGIAYDRSTVPRSDAGLSGTALDNVSLCASSSGMLEVRSAAVGQTYWPTPEVALAGGCFRTSDLVEMDGPRVLLRGRAGDVINVAGRKLSPETVERVLAAHPGVRDCLVLGLPVEDDARSECVAAVVVATPGTELMALKTFLLERLPAWQVPREWRLVESLAANVRGKLSRAEWRKKFRNRV